MVAKRWVPEVLAAERTSVAPSRSGDTCAYCIFALLSALANTPSPLHTGVPKPSSWHPPPALGRLGGTWELNLYHPSDRGSNISGVQHFTGDRRGTGQKAPPGTPPPRRSAREHGGRKVSTGCKRCGEEERAILPEHETGSGLCVCHKYVPPRYNVQRTFIRTRVSVGHD